MAAGNDHDYLARRSRRLVSGTVILGQIPERLLMTTSASNADHDYLSGPANSQNGNSTASTQTGSLDPDYDIFQADEDEEDDSGEADTEAIDGGTTSASSDVELSSILNFQGQSDSDATTYSVLTYDTSSMVSARSSNGSTISEVSTSAAASRSQSESTDNASTDQRQQEDTDPTSSPVSEQPPATDEPVINLSTPSPPKKRKRLSLEPKDKSTTPKVKSADDDNDDEDDGLTCPICLDSWEMSGEHRLTSLKCGHLFGESCIRRWLQESARQSGQKVCPQCKTKATPRDLRYLYAKRLRAIDRSEEHRMRDELCNERSRSENLILELATMKMTYAQVTMKLKSVEADNQSLKKMLRTGGGGTGPMGRFNEKSHISYKLFMEKNIELPKDSGCRVMRYADHHAAILVSQKSAQGLFPGYGVRLIDTTTFKTSNYIHTSLKAVRDICLSEDQQLLAAASMEQKVNLFDFRTLQSTTQFKPSEKPIWSCAIAQSEHCIYLGSQQGSTYVCDIRYPQVVLSEHFTEGDNSPAIQVAAVPENAKFSFGGFLVCKLTSLWFYEYLPEGRVQGTRLGIEGRLISMSYNVHNQTLMVQTRSCPRYPGARFIVGKLDQIDCIPVLDIKVTFTAMTNSPVMTRSTQIEIDSNTIVAGYIQDTKRISIYDTNSEQCIQSLAVQEVVYDICPVYVKDTTYVAALSESKCRLYKVHAN